MTSPVWENLTRAAMDMSMDMIYLVEPETLTFLDVNDTAARAYGFSREEVLAMGPSARRLSPWVKPWA